MSSVIRVKEHVSKILELLQHEQHHSIRQCIDEIQGLIKFNPDELLLKMAVRRLGHNIEMSGHNMDETIKNMVLNHIGAISRIKGD